MQGQKSTLFVDIAHPGVTSSCAARPLASLHTACTWKARPSIFAYLEFPRRNYAMLPLHFTAEEWVFTQNLSLFMWMSAEFAAGSWRSLNSRSHALRLGFRIVFG